MGQWFARFLLQESQQVIITGRNERKLLEVRQQLDVETSTNLETVKHADVILISVPIDDFEQVVEQIAPHTHSGQAILDITSVKVLPVEIMHKQIGTGVTLGTHPLFGPGAKNITNQNFVLTPTNNKESALAEKIKEYLEAKGARVTQMTPREHDEMMTVILGLSHFIAIVSADTLLSSDKFQRMQEIGGTTYKMLLTLIESVISEDPELYASLQMNLPRMAEIEELFQRNAKTWADIVRNRDRQEFVKKMSALRTELETSDPDFHKAYENMYKLMER